VESEFIIQGSTAGPASGVITGSDLLPLTPRNSMVKFANEEKRGLCAEEIKQVGDCAIAQKPSLESRRWSSFLCDADICFGDLLIRLRFQP